MPESWEADPERTASSSMLAIIEDCWKRLGRRLRLCLCRIGLHKFSELQAIYYTSDEIPGKNHMMWLSWGSSMSSPYCFSMLISKVISWISCSDFPPSQIVKEFVGRMKSGPKDIGTATFETLRICERSMNYWDRGLSFWRQRPEHAANDLSTVKEKETHRKSNKWLQRENHRKMSEDLSGKG
jgi:hypothetical protein